MRETVKTLLMFWILVFVLSCDGSSTDNEQDEGVFTLLSIHVLGSDIYTESEKMDALDVVDLYWDITRDCVLELNTDREDDILAVNPDTITINIKSPLISEITGQEFFLCSSGMCSADINGRRIATVPSLPALGHEFGHFWNNSLFENTNHNDNDLSIVCDTPRICHEYMVNTEQLGCE